LHPSRDQLKMITATVATNRIRLRLSGIREGSGKIGQQAQKVKMLET
jgi:hypothetical protein